MRNLRSVLDTMAAGRPCGAPPNVSITSKPTVILLRANSFHCDGLFPWNNRLAFIFSPSVFSPTRWVCRHLTVIEMLKMMDVPDTLQSALMTANRAALCKDCPLLPMKVVVRLLDMSPLETCQKIPLLTQKRLKVDGSETSVQPEPPSSAPTVDEISPHLISSVLSSTSTPEDITSLEAKRNLKATKSDDAPVPEYLWDHVIVAEFDPHYATKVHALGRLRGLLLRKWKWNLLHEFLSWFRSHHTSNITTAGHRDWIAGADCIRRAWNSSWWSSGDGSCPFFW